MKCFISVVHQHCDDLRIAGGANPEGSVWTKMPEIMKKMNSISRFMLMAQLASMHLRNGAK